MTLSETGRDFEFLTLEEAYAELRISRATLFRLIRRREVGVVRIAGRTFIERAEIRRFVAAGRTAAIAGTSEAAGRIGDP